MKVNCGIIDDLLPLYVEDSCSAESRAAIEEHLKDCPACMEKLRRMSSKELSQPTQALERETQLVAYKKKIRRHKIYTMGMAALAAVLLAAVLFLGWLTVQDMHRQASPKVYPVEEGVCNLTASEVVTTTTEAEQFLLYTNYEQIAVSFPTGHGGEGRVILQNANGDELQVFQSTPSVERCVFANLTSVQRYRIVCEELTETDIAISEGRVVSVWSSLRSVLGELRMLIFGM